MALLTPRDFVAAFVQIGVLRGRASRRQAALFYAFDVAALVALAAGLAMLGVTPIVILVSFIALDVVLAVPRVTITIRRMRDMGSDDVASYAFPVAFAGFGVLIALRVLMSAPRLAWIPLVLSCWVMIALSLWPASKKAIGADPRDPKYRIPGPTLTEQRDEKLGGYYAAASAFLDELDASTLVAGGANPEDMRSATSPDLGGGGANLIRHTVMQIAFGGEQRIGFVPKPVSESQLAVAKAVARAITATDHGKLHELAVAGALQHGWALVDGRSFLLAREVADHIVNDLHVDNDDVRALRARTLVSDN